MSYHGRVKVERVCGFHCVARVARQAFLLDEGAREQMVRALGKAADFCGVELLTYAILSNHLHLLVRVDPRAKEVSDAELVRRFRCLYGRERAQCLGHNAEELACLFADAARAEAADKARAKLRARMGDVSAFMQTLKQRYTKWYNRARGGAGTLWAERFRSVLVQDAPGPLRTVAAYIDLNAVRAGMVNDPAHYRWCGHAAAVGGARAMREAARARFYPRAADTGKALEDYRLFLLGKGAAPKRGGGGARVPEAILEQARGSGGKLPARELLLLRGRHFTQGLVLGTRDFVAEMLRAPGVLRFRRRRAPKPVPSPAGGEALACAAQWHRKPHLVGGHTATRASEK